MSNAMPGSPWKMGALWAVPMALWVVALPALGLGLASSWSNWRQARETWPAAIADSRSRGEEDMAGRQEGWLARDNRNGLIGCSGFAAALLLLGVGVPLGYRRLVPARWRGGGRAFLLAVPVLLLLGVVAFAVLSSALAGVIKG